MAAVAHFGTFDVANYGDLLFPLILERRLRDLDLSVIHVSPRGGPPVWRDCLPTIAPADLREFEGSLAAVIVGGGHIIHTSPSLIEAYDLEGLDSILAYPNVWLAPAATALRHDVPYLWNAPGAPQDFSPTSGRLVEWATSFADVLAVRDRISRSRLLDAGVTRPVRIIPDTALEVSRLWPAEAIDAAHAEAFQTRGREAPARTAAVHLNPRYAGGNPQLLAQRLDRIAQSLDATMVLLALGPCHGDAELQRSVGRLMASRPLVIDQPQSLLEMTACIARSELYLGSSLHGMIAACSFGTRGMVVVPDTAGAVGKFDGFLEQFQLQQWRAPSWEAAEERLDDLTSGPHEVWARVLEVASPLLDEHWARMLLQLTVELDEIDGELRQRRRQAALTQMAVLSAIKAPGDSLLSPIVADQAIQSVSHLKRAVDERNQKEAATEERNRLRNALSGREEEIEQTRRERDLLHDELARLQGRLAAERDQGAHLQTSIDHLHMRLEREESHTATAQAARNEALADLESIRIDALANIETVRNEALVSLEAARAAAHEERATQEIALRALERGITELQDEREATAAAHAEMQALWQTEVHSMRGAHEAREREWQQTLDALTKERADLQHKLQNLTHEHQTLQQDWQNLTHEHQALQHELLELGADREALVVAHARDLSRAQTETSDTRRVHEALHLEWTRSIESLHQERAALQEELHTARNHLSSERAALQGALHASRAEHEREQAAAAERHQAMAAELRAENARVARELERLHDEVERLHDEVRDQIADAELEALQTEELLQAVGQHMAQIDALLAAVATELPPPAKKKKQHKGSRATLQMRSARQTLHAVRTALGEHRAALAGVRENRPGMAGASSRAAANGAPRILSGRPKAQPGMRNGSPNGHAGAAPRAHLADASHPEAIERPRAHTQPATVDIVICIHDALDDVTECLASVTRHGDATQRIILVDDGSGPDCAAYLREFAATHDRVELLRGEEATGYTRAANRGLRAATADFVILLNSDTIVTSGWVARLLECAGSDPRIGIVGPLSNAASYQSVPGLVGENGDWSLNPLPPGWDADAMASAVAAVSSRAYPRVPFVNGFCFGITRAAIDAIGHLDESAFPDGYGEENDYCLRAADAGFALAIADHAYVYHAKSRSYSHERRRELGKLGRAELLRKHGLERLEEGEALLRQHPKLTATREALDAFLSDRSPRPQLSVLFLLPVSGGGGGAHSVVQEASGMRRLGVDAQVAIRAQHLARYQANYPAIAERDQLFFAYRSLEELQAYAAGFSVVVATIHTSMPLLAAIAAASPEVMPAYYIQDYEPLFHEEGSAENAAALASYTLVPHAVLFAKTRWLCDTVGALHDVVVHKVRPSLDHEVYYPSSAPQPREAVRVVAMVRPSSPRRGPGRTMEVLRRLTREFGKRVEVQIFGCSEADLVTAELPVDFPFTNHGVLTRESVADVLRESDIFLDLSDYQAFGRTGLEAMACGCAVVLPALGGTSEYAVHGENSLLVDTSQTDHCYEAASALVEHDAAREQLRAAALAKASEYSIDRAAESEINLFSAALESRSSDLTLASGRFTRGGLG